MLVRSKRRVRKARDTGDILIDQIGILMGSDYQISLQKERRWASITFSGTRYSIAIVKTGVSDETDFSKSLNSLIDHDFGLPGKFVADVLVRDEQSSEISSIVEILAIADPVSEEIEPAID